jgi:hypothetical protein
MPQFSSITRRSALILLTGTATVPCAQGWAEEQVVTVHKDPNCGCCTGWANHLQQAGFTLKIIETTDIDAVKKRLNVPADLAACHTAEVAGYVVEGHVPASALKRFLNEKPNATGLAVPGMPIGSPGMDGGTPETYTVIQFGPQGRTNYMRFFGPQEL